MSEPRTRSQEQNNLFHQQIGVIAAQTTHYGQRLDKDDWKRLLLNAFKFDTKNDPDLRDEWAKFGEMKLIPALNNPGFVAVGESSRRLGVKLASAFVEWLYAYGTEVGVKFPADPRQVEHA
jgi:hypothetical protein